MGSCVLYPHSPAVVRLACPLSWQWACPLSQLLVSFVQSEVTVWVIVLLDGSLCVILFFAGRPIHIHLGYNLGYSPLYYVLILYCFNGVVQPMFCLQLGIIRRLLKTPKAHHTLQRTSQQGHHDLKQLPACPLTMESTLWAGLVINPEEVKGLDISGWRESGLRVLPWSPGDQPHHVSVTGERVRMLELLLWEKGPSNFHPLGAHHHA